MTNAEVDRVKVELEKHYAGRVEVEEVSPGRYRFEVFSRHFGSASHLARHDAGWAFVSGLLDRQGIDGVASLLLYAPEDVDAELAAAIP